VTLNFAFPRTRKRTSRRSLGVATGAVLAALFTACSGGTPTASGGSGANGGGGAGAVTGSTTQSEQTAGEAGGGEAAAIRFVSGRYHYQVDAPGTMTESADGTATASHGLESLEIVVRSGSSVSNPAGYANSDLSSLRSKPGFSLKSGPEGINLSASSSSVKTVFSAAGPTNPVTGKAQTFVTVRYYVPRNSSTLAVLTYSIALDQYDPQGADDVANTFVWQ
jgi:hypothetical protein